MKGSKIILSGEYARMQQTFRDLGIGMILAVLLMYFLMVALDKSYIVPLTVMLTVPISMAGVFPMLYLTGTAINVQSILGIIFIIGIKVANTVLMTDFAQEIRRHEGLTPDPGDPQGGLGPRPAGDDDRAGRVLRHDPRGDGPGAGLGGQRPARPRDPRRPPGREPATLFVLPCLYMLMVKDKPGQPGHEPGDQGHPESEDHH